MIVSSVVKLSDIESYHSINKNLEKKKHSLQFLPISLEEISKQKNFTYKGEKLKSAYLVTFNPTQSMIDQITQVGTYSITGTVAAGTKTIELVSALEDHIPGFSANWTSESTKVSNVSISPSTGIGQPQLL